MGKKKRGRIEYICFSVPLDELSGRLCYWSVAHLAYIFLTRLNTLFTDDLNKVQLELKQVKEKVTGLEHDNTALKSYYNHLRKENVMLYEETDKLNFETRQLKESIAFMDAKLTDIRYHSMSTNGSNGVVHQKQRKTTEDSNAKPQDGQIKSDESILKTNMQKRFINQNGKYF